MADGIDQDCDDGDTCWVDADSDGYRETTGTTVDSTDLECTDAGEGASSEPATDCDDTDASVSPGEIELCDAADTDEDCDGYADDDDEASGSSTWYPDVDADGYGDEGDAGTAFCDDPGTDWSTDATDCDDADGEVSPAGMEVCNDTDDDCDGTVDDDATDATTWYADADGDGYGGDTTSDTCDQPSGYVASSGDCDDTTTAFPATSETFDDGDDDDCDGCAQIFEDAFDGTVGSSVSVNTDWDGGAGVYAANPADSTDTCMQLSGSGNAGSTLEREGFASDFTMEFELYDPASSSTSENSLVQLSTSSGSAAQFGLSPSSCGGYYCLNDGGTLLGARPTSAGWTSFHVEVDYTSSSGGTVTARANGVTASASFSGTLTTLRFNDDGDTGYIDDIVIWPGASSTCSTDTGESDTGSDTGTVDADGDGSDSSEDCDDADASTFPGVAPDDSTTACMTDADGDGYGDEDATSPVEAGSDCDDGDSSFNPGATDTHNDGVDTDCDGYETVTTSTSEGCWTFGGTYRAVIVTASLYHDGTSGLDNSINIYESGTSGDAVTATLWYSSGYNGLYLVTQDGGSRTHEDRLTTISAGMYDIVLTVDLDTSYGTLQWGTSEAEESVSYMSSLSAGCSDVFGSAPSVYVDSLEVVGRF